MDSNGDPQIFLLEGTERVWRSGPWVGKEFSRIPGMGGPKLFNFSFDTNAD